MLNSPDESLIEPNIMSFWNQVTCSYLLGELLGEYHGIKTIKTLNIYILAYHCS